MPILFKNITDLNQGTVISGTDVIEMVHNPGVNGENVQVTVNTLAAAIGGGGGGQIIEYSGTYPSSPPANSNSPAIAYSADGTGSVWFWNVTGQTWI